MPRSSYDPGSHLDEIRGRWNRAGSSPSLLTFEEACRWVYNMTGKEIIYVNFTQFREWVREKIRIGELDSHGYFQD
jgi:hypothetical protein